MADIRVTYVYGPLVTRVLGVIENVYVQADLTDMNKTNGTYSWPIAMDVDHTSSSGQRYGELRNVIFNLTGYSGSKKLIGSLGGPLNNVYVLINNAYTVSNTTGGAAADWYNTSNSLGKLTNCGLFNSESDYKAVVNSSNATVTGAFDTSANGYWKFDANNMLVFKTVS